MSVFDLHSTVLTDYRDFVRSFFTVADDRAREYVERALVEEVRLWPDFLLQVSPSYVRTDTVEALAGRGELHGDRRQGHPLAGRSRSTDVSREKEFLLARFSLLAQLVIFR